MKRILKATVFTFIFAVAASAVHASCPDRWEWKVDGVTKICTLREDSFNNYCFYDCKVVSQ